MKKGLQMKDLIRNFEEKKETLYKEHLEKEEEEILLIRKDREQPSENAPIPKKIRQGSDIENALKNAEASLNVEGMYLQEDERDLILRRLRGEISHDQFVEIALKLADVN